jgi:hypothetical protein
MVAMVRSVVRLLSSRAQVWERSESRRKNQFEIAVFRALGAGSDTAESTFCFCL